VALPGQRCPVVRARPAAGGQPRVDPPAYGLARTKGLFLLDGFEQSTASGLWKSLLAGLETQTVPCWIDFR
jgi:hypothetical protein